MLLRRIYNTFCVFSKVMYVLIQADLRYITTEPGEQFVITPLTIQMPLLLVGNLDTSKSMLVIVHNVLLKSTLIYRLRGLGLWWKRILNPTAQSDPFHYCFHFLSDPMQ